MNNFFKRYNLWISNLVYTLAFIGIIVGLTYEVVLYETRNRVQIEIELYKAEMKLQFKKDIGIAFEMGTIKGWEQYKKMLEDKKKKI